MKIYTGTQDEKEIYIIKRNELNSVIEEGKITTMISFPNTEYNPIWVASDDILCDEDYRAIAYELGYFDVKKFKIQVEYKDKLK